MKLRNKKTGEIWDIPKMRYPTIQADDISFFAMQGTNGILFSYKSLAELNEEWEDYKPAEPLIKDEKIRKAVRAWAEANGEEGNIVFTRSCEYSDYMFYTNGGGDICFEQAIDLTTGSYTITELCGEEEG